MRETDAGNLDADQFAGRRGLFRLLCADAAIYVRDVFALALDQKEA
ncbi:hypothetical protein [Pseudophaeobacter profundi]|nr:hypothetical protein [Pseudophaeobacter profundi]